MAGPYEEKLDKATNAQPVVIMQAADTWKKAADGLGKVADADRHRQAVDRGRLEGRRRVRGDGGVQQPEQQRAHEPDEDGAGEHVAGHRGADPVDAQGAYNTLPAARRHAGTGAAGSRRPGPAPGADPALAGGRLRRRAGRRPGGGPPRRAYQDLKGGLGDAQITMNAVAPPRYSGDDGGTGGNPPVGPTGGPRFRRPTSRCPAPRAADRSVPTPPAPPAPTCTPSSSGTSTAAGSCPTSRTRGPAAACCRATTARPPTGSSAGTVAGGTGGGSGTALGLPGGVGGAPGVIGGSSTGSLAGGAVGGLAGMLGGAGGALGALRGGASSGSSVAGRLAGKVGGLTGWCDRLTDLGARWHATRRRTRHGQGRGARRHGHARTPRARPARRPPPRAAAPPGRPVDRAR